MGPQPKLFGPCEFQELGFVGGVCGNRPVRGNKLRPLLRIVIANGDMDHGSGQPPPSSSALGSRRAEALPARSTVPRILQGDVCSTSSANSAIRTTFSRFAHYSKKVILSSYS